LTGSLGNRGEVFRDGDMVIRPLGPHAQATTALLEALASTSFTAPVPLGRTADGSQTFRWIDGVTPTPPRPAWSLTDDALGSAARLLRSYHDTVADLDFAPELQWSDVFADPKGGPLICHNDPGPPNVVFRDERAVALLDFDFAAPGRGVWDLAHMAQMWVRLRPADMATDSPYVDPFPRLALIAGAYGLDENEYEAFVEALIDSWRVTTAFVRGRMAEGQPQYVQTWERNGGEAGRDRVLSWLIAQQHTMLTELRNSSQAAL
jgi:aminoglycoside phosphotransferase (APT) family kinase protein